ncbi:unnamed protein product, partial [Didymodactylos carnosus]
FVGGNFEPSPKARLDAHCALPIRTTTLYLQYRLVVDTGIHSKQWSREQATEYMMKNTCMHRTEVVTEIDRYFVLPGQACAYMVGCLKILSLRQKAQDALKTKFDIKKFHEAVLVHGCLPLTLLEQVIDDYIEREKQNF